MTTASEYARTATAALQQALHLSAKDFDAEGTTGLIERIIQEATTESGSQARRELQSVQSLAQERLARLLSASPSVIYSFKARDDFAPTFISDNIVDVFGYAPAEYLEAPPSGATGSTPTTWPARRRRPRAFSRTGPRRSSTAFDARTGAIAG